ncbi:MAG: macro domain-containing protein, partial [Oscillospiraceae bacterium]|nr:macro domain-containing protein [Oscillospiraceae bacterium]
MPFRIIRNDITKVQADAIVNTANPEPAVGGGTDWDIHSAAGPALLEARKKIGKIAVGESRATPAYELPAKYVLHTVSPMWIDGTQHEQELLRQAYDAALMLADELGCASVAFPLMAAGTYGFPLELALSTAIHAFTDFLLEHEIEIDLVLFNADAFDLAGSLFTDVKSYVDENYVGAREAEEYRIDRIPASENAPPESMLRESARRLTLARRRKAYSSEAPHAAPREESEAREEASLEEILKRRDKTFSEYLLELLKKRSGRDSEVYKRAEVSKQLFSKILSNPDYQPTKSTAIQIAIGLELNVKQTQDLLGRAGYALTRSSRTDLVVQYYISRGIYSVSFINEALYDCGLPLLKTGL